MHYQYLQLYDKKKTLFLFLVQLSLKGIFIMKVLFVASSLSYGGAEKMIAFVANGLCERKHKILIVNLLEEPDEVQKLDTNIQIEHIKTASIRYIDKIDRIRQLRRYIKKEKPDAIITFKSTPTWITCVANMFMHIPIIFSERGDPNIENLKRPRTYLYWKMINHCAGAVFQTEGAKEYYEKELQDRSVVIPNPVDPILNDNCNKEIEEKAIVSFGRFENRQKRYDVMIDAFDIFYKTHKDYILKLYGTGEDEQIIRKWVINKNIQDVVKFMGYTGKPYKQMKNGNIFLITSDYEGISNAMLEAMAAGYPVISTDCSPGGARMVIQNRHNGLLAPIGDCQKIAEALCCFADDDDLRWECAKRAKEVTVRFNPDKIMNEWEKYVIETTEKAR